MEIAITGIVVAVFALSFYGLSGGRKAPRFIGIICNLSFCSGLWLIPIGTIAEIWL